MFRHFGIALLLSSAFITHAVSQERVRVEVDKAHILRLEKPAATLIIGNPMIADATIHSDKLLVITGKSYGTTNLIALDGDGKEIAARTIDVQYASKALITVHKGAQRQSLSCAPVCETTLNVGDSKTYFEELTKQIQARVDLASGKAGKAKE